MLDEEKKEQTVEKFLDLIRQSRKGKFKLYIGMIAGVGKTYRMLKEVRGMLKRGVDVQIGFIETHGREDTDRQLEGLPIIPRKKVFYRGKELEEMDLQAILNLHPEIVVVDELAHTNIPGSKNEKRWQDVMELIDAGISVISAVNIQHIDSLSAEIEELTGVVVQERVPDHLLGMADEILNIDLPADELINRLKEGKIYKKEQAEIALRNFFQPEKILQLRELALKEVAGQVERKIETQLFTGKRRPEKFMACITTNQKTAKKIIRKTSRMANYYTSNWMVLYVQTSGEALDRINLSDQRYLLNNLKLAAELGAEIIRVKSNNIATTIFSVAVEKQITTILVGVPTYSLKKYLLHQNTLRKLLKKLAGTKIDLIIVS
jgi:two-component system sensor histidine kinase KdpD